MAKILCIETSTSVCSVAYCEDGKVVSSKELYEINSHASHLTVLIDELFTEPNTPTLQAIDAVAVSSGPGSYTGLRIGVSTAKGICFGLGKPLIAIDSLTIMSYPVVKSNTLETEAATLFCPMMDAKRMEVYTSLFDREMNQIEPISAKIIEEDAFLDQLQTSKIVFFGNGAEKCQSTITHVNASFLSDSHPLAKNMATLVEEKYQNQQFEDVAYFEPFYLKEFMITQSKKKVL